MIARLRAGKRDQRGGYERQAPLGYLVQRSPALAGGTVPEFDLLRIVLHVSPTDRYFSLRRRIASVRKRKALSLMNPDASF